MPAYDYKCKKCGKVFEYQQRISEDALTNCPESICDQELKGTGNVERIISKNIGLVFKGSGFYLTDYNNSKDKAAKPANTETKETKTEKISETKTEKSETKIESKAG